MKKALVMLIVLLGVFLAIGCAGEEGEAPEEGTPVEEAENGTPVEVVTQAEEVTPVTEADTTTTG